MALDWRDTLRTLRTQFEAKAAASTGLHHLFTEVPDDDRSLASGPDWFAPFSARQPRVVNGKIVYEKWECSSSSGLPGVSPSFRAVLPDEDLSTTPDERIVRDQNGNPQAVSIRQKLRQGFYCGPAAETVGQFESLATAVATALSVAIDLVSHPFAAELTDLFRPPRGGVRYVFGDVPAVPDTFISRGWNAGVLQYPDGVLIDLPISETPVGASHWLLLLHRLGWRQISGSLVRAQRYCANGNSEIAFEMLDRDTTHTRDGMDEFLSRFSRESFYSMVGNKEVPDDLFLTSAFAINLLLTQLSDDRDAIATQKGEANYENEAWKTKTIPDIRTVEKNDVGAAHPTVGILVATETERVAVLKRLTPSKGRRSVIQVFAGNNTFFLGKLGTINVALCMCAMGATGRDSSLVVASEMIETWDLPGIIMVGIAFGKDSTLQRIGNVLISERVISYEPERIGSDDRKDRGAIPQAGTLLLNRFRNVVGWTFESPNGQACGFQVGSLLSGEKLVDDAAFKASLFERFPDAIGGEMEGAGVAAAADRKKCEWILVKAICDWGDGTKTKLHQEFSAAAAIDLVAHVLNQANALDDLSRN